MDSNSYKYFIINKPYNMVSQFIGTDKEKTRLLGKLNFNFPEGIHAIGRLDSMSEGLLILTTDKRITKLLFESKTPHKRTYLVYVSNQVTEETLQKWRTGITIHIKGDRDYITSPCEVEIVENPVTFPTPIVIKEYVPHTWLKMTLTEGKYHQVRKMVFALKHKCKRLIRISIEDLELENLQPGEVKEIDAIDFFNLLKLKK